MTNDEIPNDEGSPKSEYRIKARQKRERRATGPSTSSGQPSSSLGISSFVIAQPGCFVIRHFPRCPGNVDIVGAHLDNKGLE